MKPEKKSLGKLRADRLKAAVGKSKPDTKDKPCCGGCASGHGCDGEKKDTPDSAIKDIVKALSSSGLPGLGGGGSGGGKVIIMKATKVAPDSAPISDIPGDKPITGVKKILEKKPAEESVKPQSDFVKRLVIAVTEGKSGKKIRPKNA